MAIATLISTIGDLLLSGYGMYAQEMDNQAVRKDSMNRLAQDQAKEERRYRTDLAMTKENIAYQREQDARTWKWKEEDQSWQRGREFADRLTSMVEKTPELQNRLINIWGK